MDKIEKPCILFFHDKPSGGAGESLFHMIETIRTRYQPVIVFTNEGFVKEKFDRIIEEVPQYYFNCAGSWLLNRDFGNSILNNARFMLALPKMKPLIDNIRKVAKKHNALAIYSNTIYLIEGALAARKLGIPHFWQVRELFDLEYYQYGIPKKQLVKMLQFFSNKIICNSYRTKRTLHSFFPKIKKDIVIYNLVSPPFEQKNLKKLLGIDSSIRLIGLIGWITPNKRVEDFLEVAASFTGSDFKFVIIGGFGGGEKYNQTIRKLMESNPNKENIIHTGIIPNAVQYIASLDVLLCPCHTESFGRTVGEALINKVPAIGIRNSATEELISHEESGYIVEKGDTKQMIIYLRELLNDEEKRKRYGLAGLKQMQKQCSSETLSKQYFNLFSETLNTNAQKN